MGPFRSMFSVLVQPVTQTTRTVSESGRRIREDIERLKRARQRLRQDAEEARRAPHIASPLSDEELRFVDPASLKDPAQKFRALYLQHGWTEELVGKRLRAVKARKYFGIVLLLLMFTGGIISIITAPAWLALIMFIITAAGSALGLATWFLYGLYQSQLETRSIHGLSVYFSRPDLFVHLIS